MVNANIKVKRSRKTKSNATEIQMLVQSNSEDTYDIFDGQAIINSLKKELDMSEEDAISIAKKVEDHLIKANFKVVSSSFIRSLLNQILTDYGYAKWIKYSSLSIPVYDVKQLIEEHNSENSNTAFSPESINLTIAGQILKQFALREIFDKDVAESHIKGDIHIHDLDFANRIYCSGNNPEYIKKHGLKLNGIMTQSSPSRHALTLVNHLSCFTNYLQCFFSGAIGWEAVNMYFAPLLVNKSKEELKQVAQHLIYSFAQLAGARGGQTAFTDFNMYLRVPEHYKNTKAVGAGGEYTGKTYAEYENEMRAFLVAILEVLSDGDANNANFAFPKILLHITKKDKDDEIMNLVGSINSKRGSVYILYDKGDSVKISQCPLDGNETVMSLHKTYDIPIIRRIDSFKVGEEHEIYSDGEFVKGIFNEYPNQKMYKIGLTNKHSITMSENHLNLCIVDKDRKDMQTLSLKEIKDKFENGEDVWLPYSNSIFKGSGGNFELGYIVGCFAGDGNGTFEHDSKTVKFCLSKGFKDKIKDRLIEYVTRYFGGNHSISGKEEEKGYFLRFSSQALLAYCREFIVGIKRDKHYHTKLFAMSEEFRRGVFEGHLDTDGRACQNRIYTGSSEMVKSIIALATTLGTVTSVNEDMRDNRLGNDVVYCVLVFKNNMPVYKDIYFKYHNKTWIRINSIDFIGNRTGYCFEVTNSAPVFTVMSSGILTHNCRLSINLTKDEVTRMTNAPEEMRFSAWQNVTLILPRIAYKHRTVAQIHKEIDRLLHIVMKAHINKRDYILKLLAKGNDGCLNFLTTGMDGKPYTRPEEAKFLVGIIGLNEMVQCLTGKQLHESDDALLTGLNIMAYIYKSMNTIAAKYGLTCLLEETPAEGLSLRSALLDLKQFPQAQNYIKGNIETGNIYYTNSVHLSYEANVDILTRIEKQSKFAPMIQAGSIIHNWFGEHEPDPTALKNLYFKVLEHTNAVQTADSPDMTVCESCHSMSKGLHTECPKCKSTKVYQMTRITGYFSKTSGWTKSKLAELKDRVRVNLEMTSVDTSVNATGEVIYFFSKPDCEKCDFVKKQLLSIEHTDKINIVDTKTYDGLALACYYDINLLPAIIKVVDGHVISKLEQTGSFLKWIKENI